MAYEGEHLFYFINVMVGEQLQIYFINIVAAIANEIIHHMT